MVEMKTVIPKIDEETGVAWLTFNRPEKKNAMSQRFMAEMIKRFSRNCRQRQDQMCRDHGLG